MEKQRSYEKLIERYAETARTAGAQITDIGKIQSDIGEYTLYRMHLRCGEGKQRLCISTGMHGDEPAGPESLLKIIARLGELRDSLNADFLFFPCDNPSGYELNTRENWQGLDLNREFVQEEQAAEIAIVENDLRGRAFDFTLDLHEDVDTYGMYLYERARKGYRSVADSMIAELRARDYPIHEADWIEGLPASGGIIWPSGRLRKRALPKAVFLWQNGSPHLVTTESPGKLELSTRVEMQMICFDVVLKRLLAEEFAAAPVPSAADR